MYALRRMLRPIVRLLIRIGVRYPEFADLARGVFVECAIRDADHRGRTPTRARVAMISGITRRQVNNYIDNEGTIATGSASLTAALVEILHKWHTDPHYAGPYGIPLELELANPPDRCFRSLAALVDPRVDAASALDALLATGSITISGERYFRAASRYFMMPEPMSPQQIEYFGRILPRLAETLEYNMNPLHSEKRLERFVKADQGLPESALPAFEDFARHRTIEYLLDLDNWLAQHANEGADEGDRVDAGVNVFLYAEPPPSKAPLASLVSGTSSSSKRA